MKRFTRIAPLEMVLAMSGLFVHAADEGDAAETNTEQNDTQYIEDIIVTGERGEQSSLERAMSDRQRTYLAQSVPCEIATVGDRQCPS